MSDKHAAALALLEKMKREFAEALPGRLEALEGAASACREGGFATESVADFHRLAHSLAGSGATFGFAATGAAARALEIRLKVLLEAQGAPGAEMVEELEELLEAVGRACASELEGLAAAPSAPEAAVPPVVEGGDEGGAPSYTRGARLVYVVEDDAEHSKLLVRQLAIYGYRVKRFASPDELEAVMDVELPAAVFMDIGFPEGENAGIDAAAAIHQRHGDAVPLIFVSQRDDFEARLAALRAGGRAYFNKPVDVGQVVDRLDALLGGGKPEPYRILLVEDSETLATYYAAALEQSTKTQAGMEVRVVTDPTRADEPLAEFHPDLILMDVYMPGCSGIELATLIRQREGYVGIPIVFLSAETDVGKQLAAMAEGGDDFLTKPIEAAHLRATVASRVVRARAMRALMERDSLTGLLNHTRIKARLEGELARARRQGGPLAFAMIDIDHFKSVNDTYGHPTGDRVIRGLARFLTQRLRTTDVVGRYGGEEFAVILPDTHPEDARAVLDEVRKGFAQIAQSSDGASFFVTISCGVVGEAAGEDGAALNDAADKALYEAKHAGRNRVVLGGGR